MYACSLWLRSFFLADFSRNAWIDGLYSGLLLASSKLSIFPQGHVAPVLPQSRSSMSLGFRYVYTSAGTAMRKAHGLELKLTLLPLTVVPWLPALKAVMDAFDVASKKQEPSKLDVSPQDSIVPTSRQPVQDQESYFEMPQLHVDIDDVVVLLPVEGRVTDTSTDKVILFRLSSLSLIPRPQNPIPRPIRGEQETILPRVEGYCCDEKQLQLNVATIEVWTAEWEEIAPNLISVGHEMLSDTAPGVGEQNPALEWNIAGRSEMFS